MIFLDTILIKTAGICNLNCSYCYVYHSKDTSFKKQAKVMSEKTIDLAVSAIIKQSYQQDRGFSIVLHGGEPLILGFNKLKTLLNLLRDKLNKDKYPISIQTNGTLLTMELIELFSETHTSVSISLDGNKKINDIARVDHLNNSSFDKVISGIKLLQSHPNKDFLFTGILSVINPSNSVNDIYSFFKSLSVPSMNFLLADGNIDNLPFAKQDLNSTEYAEWIIKLIELYLLDDEPNEIPFIDELIKLSLGQPNKKEGIGERLFGILIIETDGEIRKNDTLRSSFDGADFFNKRPNIENVSLLDILESKEFKDTAKMQTNLAKECKKCDIVEICGGGMPLYRWSDKNKYDNPSVYCSDHKLYINKIKTILKDNNDL